MIWAVIDWNPHGHPPIFVDGRHAAAQAACAHGGRVLEIGVGTGMSFDGYDETTEITGIDMSAPMIARARKRLESGCYPFVKGLRVMDAHGLSFPDASFDCAVGQFVITLVENPVRFRRLAERTNEAV